LQPLRDVHCRSPSAQSGHRSLAEHGFSNLDLSRLNKLRAVVVPDTQPAVGIHPVAEQTMRFDYPSSARSAFASSRSLVSKPSVNQS
jgi:hypothetical protein